MAQNKNLTQAIQIPRIFDDCYLYFAQNPDHIPFGIKRIYFITNAKTKFPRGFHAHRKTQQVLFCIQGSIKLTLDNGHKREQLLLNHPSKGIFINKMVWHEMYNFKKNTILLVLTSRVFNEGDYIRDYEKFKNEADRIR